MMATTTRATGRLGPSALLLVAVLSGGVARAALPDPTRPPPGMASPPGPALVLGITSPAPAAPPRALPAATPASATARPPTALPRVQALLHPDGAPAGPAASALIDGRLLRIGDRLGDATVQEIRPDGVWLRGPQGSRQWLGLFATTEAPASRKEP